MGNTVRERRISAPLGILLVVFAFAAYTRPQGLTGSVILVAAAALLTGALVTGARMGRPIALPWCFVSLAVLSALWSSQPWVTFTLSVGLAFPLLLAQLIAANLSFPRFLEVADVTLKILVVGSIAAALILPSVGVTQRDVNAGAWRGLFEHRNGLGFVVVLAVITHIAVRWSKSGVVSRYGWLLIFGLALWRAGSSGAFVLITIGVLTYLVVQQVSHERNDNRRPVFIAFGFFSVSAMIAVSPFISNLLAFVGRDLTFSGRVDIWRGAITAWRENFVLGYGWGNILGDENIAANVISGYSGYVVRSTHNGYLAVALQLGVVGVVLGVLYLCGLLLASLRMSVRTGGPQAFWSLQVVLILVVGDFAETRAFVNIGWFLLATVGYYAISARTAGVTPLPDAKRQSLSRSTRSSG